MQEWTPEQLAAIHALREDMNFDERLWVARMIQFHGVQFVAENAASLRAQVEFARGL